jgi:hypothetical protein
MNPTSDTGDSTFDAPATKPYRGHAQAAWLLMSIVALLSFIPLFGFAVWLVAAPMLLVSFILIVLVFVKGGTSHGLALLACQVLVMPLLVAFGPFISSALGIASGAAALGGTAAAVASLDTPNLTTPTSIPNKSTPRTPSESKSFQLPPQLLDLKTKLTHQRPQVTRWLIGKLAEETELGYLRPVVDANLDLETRRAIQQENVWRKEAFAFISEISRKPLEEVAATYARLATER